MPAADTDNLALRAAMIDNYNRYAEGLDTKNWPLVRSCFCDEILIDYGQISAPTGAPDVPRRADDWMAVLQGVINGFDFTRHAITNHRFELSPRGLRCRAYLSAGHVIYPDVNAPSVGPEDIVTVVGEYCNTYSFEGGDCRICASELHVSHTEGNVALLAMAMERAAALSSGG